MAEFRITRPAYDEMLCAARGAAPVEACGLLAGTHGVVCRCYTLTNADASAEHFSLIPREQFDAVKDMRAAGLRPLAIWHSHPASPPAMSDEDLRLAYTPDMAYVILSLADPSAPELRGFQVQDGRAEPVPIVVTDG